MSFKSPYYHYSRTIWDLINSNLKDPTLKSNIIQKIKDKHGNSTSDANKKANIFNSFFINVGKLIGKKNGSLPTLDCKYPQVSSSIFLKPTDENEVTNVIKSLKNTSSSGFDEIPARLIKQCSTLLMKPLVYLINLSFEYGQFPEYLKLAVVKPIYKKGDKQDCTNYRPIAILSTFSKIFEKIFLIRILNFLNKHDILFHNQFGFRKNKSTLNAMFCFIHKIVKALDRKLSALSIFIDLTKAFDLVNHALLLTKLENIGFRGCALNWIKSYLINRKQIVELSYVDKLKYLRKAYSEKLTVNMGVPQGSVLGPILFLLFINDIKDITQNSNLCLFADDTSLTVTANDEEGVKLKAFIEGNLILQWFHNNGLFVNTNKTSYIKFNIRNRKYKHSAIHLGKSKIPSKDFVNFLGLSIDSTLNYKRHTANLTKKLNSSIFAIRKLAKYYDRQVLLASYFGCMYPHLIYAVPVWGSQNKETKYIFSLQKRAIRIIFGMKRNQSCRGVFRKNNILTFPSIYIYESIKFLKMNKELFSCTSGNLSSTRLRYKNNIKIPKHMTSFFKRNMYYSSIKLFNHLPNYIKNETSLKPFTNKLRKFLIEMEYYSVKDFYKTK